MSAPEATKNEPRVEQASPIASNQNASSLQVVNVLDVIDAFVMVEDKLASLQKTPLDIVATSIEDLRAEVVGITRQMAKAAIEAVKRVDGKAEIKGAPAIIIQRSGDYEPGEWVQDKGGIFTGEFDLVDAYGKKLGSKTNWFDAAIDLEAV